MPIRRAGDAGRFRRLDILVRRTTVVFPLVFSDLTAQLKKLRIAMCSTEYSKKKHSQWQLPFFRGAKTPHPASRPPSPLTTGEKGHECPSDGPATPGVFVGEGRLIDLNLPSHRTGLATTTGRIEFVILRTACSLPVALHLLLQERSYFQLMDSDQPMKGLAPFQSNALTGALAGTFQVP